MAFYPRPTGGSVFTRKDESPKPAASGLQPELPVPAPGQFYAYSGNFGAGPVATNMPSILQASPDMGFQAMNPQVPNMVAPRPQIPIGLGGQPIAPMPPSNIPSPAQQQEINAIWNRPSEFSPGRRVPIENAVAEEQARQRAMATAQELEAQRKFQMDLKVNPVIEANKGRLAGIEAQGAAKKDVQTLKGEQDMARTEALNRTKESIASGKNMTALGQEQMKTDRALLAQQMKSDLANGLMDKANETKKVLQDSLIKSKLDAIRLTGKAVGSPEWVQASTQKANDAYNEAVNEGLIKSSLDSKELASKMVFNMATEMITKNDKLTISEAINQASDAFSGSQLGQYIKASPNMPAQSAASQGAAPANPALAGDLDGNGILSEDEQAMLWVKSEDGKKNPIKAKAISDGLKKKYPKIYGEG